MKYWLHHGFADASNNYTITASQDSLIVSILSAGTFFGALAAAPIADRLGRRLGLIVSCGIVFNLGVILQTASTSRSLFIAGRFFAGLGVGLVSAIIPMYQSETAPKWIRGTIVGCYQLAITIGLFLAAIVNYSTQNRNDTGSYRIPIAGKYAQQRPFTMLLITTCSSVPLVVYSGYWIDNPTRITQMAHQDGET
jgi:SP family sugar:H+ symporter-like MFS transporter